MNLIPSNLGTFKISTSRVDDLSITESVNLCNIPTDTEEITLTCPSGDIRKYNNHSPIQIIEDLVTTLTTEMEKLQIEKHIYDPSLLSVEFKYFYCTASTTAVYHGILFDTNGNTYPCYIPLSVYKQIPTCFKNKLENEHYHFKFDNYGTIHLVKY